MNINPLRLFRGFAKTTDPTRNQRGSVARATHDAQPLGPWSTVLGTWTPRNADPWLYEALREAVPVLDAGIARLVTLDGIVDVEGDNAALVAEIREWMDHVPVNDVETGYQAFYASMGDEHYEQGIGVGEFVYDEKGRDVVGLRVADGKGIVFVRESERLRIFYRAPGAAAPARGDGLGTVEALLTGDARRVSATSVTWAQDNGYVELDPAQLVLAVHKPEADNPYGTSILRSLPFVAQILLKIQNSTARVWERFGDPVFHVKYASKNRQVTPDVALKRANQIASDLGVALAAKAKGNSVDIATGTGSDDEVSINIVGAQGEALEIEMPSRHMIEQIVAAFGLAPWMMGITWGQQSGIGEQQSVVVLQEAMTRFARRRAQLERPIEAMLRARGRAWKPGDWRLVQRLPNLMDETKRAQADFLRAQTALMLNDSGQVDGGQLGGGVDNGLRVSGAARRKRVHERESAELARYLREEARKGAEDLAPTGEPWAEDDDALPKLEARTRTAMLGHWHALRDAVLEELGLSGLGAKAAGRKAGEFTFDLGQLAALLARSNTAARLLAAALLAGGEDAWKRGIANAAAELALDITDTAVSEGLALLTDAMREAYTLRGMELVRGGMVREFQEKIIAQLSGGAFDGMNPLNVAERLRRQFDAGDYNWERLARSEIAVAQSDGKLALMQDQGVTLYDYTTAEDGRVSVICQTLAANGPYRVDDPNAPRPMRDSHPNCRCSIVSRE